MALFTKLNQKMNTEAVKETPVDTSLFESDLIFGQVLDNCQDIIYISESEVTTDKVEKKKKSHKFLSTLVGILSRKDLDKILDATLAEVRALNVNYEAKEKLTEQIENVLESDDKEVKRRLIRRYLRQAPVQVLVAASDEVEKQKLLGNGDDDSLDEGVILTVALSAAAVAILVKVMRAVVKQVLINNLTEAEELINEANLMDARIAKLKQRKADIQTKSQESIDKLQDQIERIKASTSAKKEAIDKQLDRLGATKSMMNDDDDSSDES